MINYIEGNLFDFDHKNAVIAHVCNNKGKWGKGFVLPLAKKYYKAKSDYLIEYQRIQWMRDKPKDMRLGENNYSFVDIDKKILVANMIAQTLGTLRPLYYNHLSKCMDDVSYLVNSHHDYSKIVCPMFGSGLAGGDWNFIEQLIIDCWIKRGIKVDVYYLNKESLPNNWSLPE